MSSSLQEYLSSADLIAGNDDLITEILLHVPAKFVIRLKLVSKRWLSLISDHNFLVRHNIKNAGSISGLIISYLQGRQVSPSCTYIPIDGNQESALALTREITFDHVPNSSFSKVLHSCNGLLLCWAQGHMEPAAHKFYVFNPTTNQFSTLPLPLIYDRSWTSFCLAYEPSKPTLYRVVCVQLCESFCNIQMYSSDTGVWEMSCNNGIDEFTSEFYHGVFWNGAIHWIGFSGHCYCFDVDQKCLQRMPSPLLPEDWNICHSHYFEESLGNLYFVAFDNTRSSNFIVFEMNRDYSGWFVKHQLNINTILPAFPDIAERYHGFDNVCISILLVVEIEGEGMKLVMYIHGEPGKVISYSFGDNAFKKLCDFGCYSGVPWWNAFKYIETSSCF
ncbi:hypothetical protein SLEP1_g17182 [Rubroshorea leprosula]|uniref:F-box domain-containing protein n=1 Tax=Rubroshorea leprosula TaxID=152421 RepID=A0AAV5IX56_9ROSI|nr:hypothetical protein SLEP1_g17182 [Rubroshorea leprosula]